MFYSVCRLLQKLKIYMSQSLLLHLMAVIGVNYMPIIYFAGTKTDRTADWSSKRNSKAFRTTCPRDANKQFKFVAFCWSQLHTHRVRVWPGYKLQHPILHDG